MGSKTVRAYQSASRVRTKQALQSMACHEIKKMKILFLNHNQEKIGTYFRCFWLGKNLSEMGHKITMICASGRKFDLLIRRRKVNKNFTIITLPRIKYGKFLTGQIELRLPLTILYVLFLRYDVCHAFTVAQPQIGIPAWVAKKIRRKRLIVDWDDLWGGGFADFHASIIKRVLYWFENKIPLIADQVTYVSEFLGDKIEKMGLKDIAVKIPNGSDPELIKPLNKEEERKLADSLGKFIGKEVSITLGVDHGLIGGMRVSIAGKLLDGSTRSRLAALKKELIGVERRH